MDEADKLINKYTQKRLSCSATLRMEHTLVLCLPENLSLNRSLRRMMHVSPTGWIFTINSVVCRWKRSGTIWRVRHRGRCDGGVHQPGTEYTDRMFPTAGQNAEQRDPYSERQRSDKSNYEGNQSGI